MRRLHRQEQPRDELLHIPANIVCVTTSPCILAAQVAEGVLDIRLRAAHLNEAEVNGAVKREGIGKRLEIEVHLALALLLCRELEVAYLIVHGTQVDTGHKVLDLRSEERRVGKECRSRWS